MTASIIRTIIIYFSITVAIRLMGKRQIGDMQPNELVVTLLISEIAAIPLQDQSRPLSDGIMAISVLVVLEIIMSVITMKSFFIRKLMSGQSIVIIKNGVIDQKAMKSVRMTVLDLVELLRGQNVFDISSVAFAVLEVNGDLSVLLKSANQPATVKDVTSAERTTTLPLPVIIDGNIIDETLLSLQLNRDKITEILKQNSLKTKQIFLMTIDRNGKYNIVKKEENGK